MSNPHNYIRWTEAEDDLVLGLYLAYASYYEISYQLHKRLGINRESTGCNQRMPRILKKRKVKTRVRKATSTSKAAVKYFAKYGIEINDAPHSKVVSDLVKPEGIDFVIVKKKPRTAQQKQGTKRHFKGSPGGLLVGFTRVAANEAKREELINLFALAIDGGYTLPDLHDALKEVG